MKMIIALVYVISSFCNYAFPSSYETKKTLDLTTMSLLISYGSDRGSTRSLAEKLYFKAQSLGIETQFCTLDEVCFPLASNNMIWLILVPTYGHSIPPRNAR